ncbi:MAG: glucan biosynthesis glucosyltransferase H, partial [Deltaproteobacteria bacterium]|nr:glucan biosynthesis glucosyltransferase H [Deltaproteobacteria bacterium]
PTLLDELKRDRRWCQGNLQHLKIIPAKGLKIIQRALFFNGVMAYSSALLWLIFLALSTAEAFVDVFRTPIYFSSARSIFPDWPVWYPQWAIALMASTVVLLFLPKLFCWFLITISQRRSGQFGGARKLAASMFLEVLVSTLLAPVRMLFHSKFVFLTLIGHQVGWGSQSREDRGTGWMEAIHFHWAGTIIGLIWGVVVFFVNRSFFWWLTPILAGLLLAIPMSVLTSRAEVGRWFRKHRWLIIQEEIDPPPEIRLLTHFIRKTETRTSVLSIPPSDGFIRAVVDPEVNALHLTLLGGPRSLAPRIVQRRLSIQSKALSFGPSSLSRKEKIELLYDPARLADLHRLVWELPAEALAGKWKVKIPGN